MTVPSLPRADVDVDALLRDVLVPALGLPAGSVSEEVPTDYMSRLPHVHAYRWGGQAAELGFSDLAVVDVHVRADLAAGGKTRALNLAWDARAALVAAAELQQLFPHGCIAVFEEQAAPVPMPASQPRPKGLVVVAATYRLWVTPPTVQP